MRYLLHKPASDLSATDLDQLVLTGELWRENRVLEYKRQLPERTDAGVVKLLKTVSSLANTDGGTVLYGVGAVDGVPTEVPGLASFNEDGDVLRLQSLLRAHLDPPLTLLRFKTVVRTPRDPVLVLEIPRSLLAPHGISFQNLGQYWARGTAGNYLMPTSELRQAFLQFEAWEQEARSFHESRRALLEAGRLGIGFDVTKPAMILHVLPLGRLRSRLTFGEGWVDHIKPDDGLAYKGVWNLDGGLVVNTDGGREVAMEYFRNGGVEIAVSLSPHVIPPNILLGEKLEQELVSWVDASLDWSGKVGAEPPYVVLLSLVRVATLRLRPPGRMAAGAFLYTGFDRSIVQLPEVVLQDTPSDASESLGEVLQIMWQAAGWKGRPGSA